MMDMTGSITSKERMHRMIVLLAMRRSQRFKQRTVYQGSSHKSAA
jgi:hypothetical protein